MSDVYTYTIEDINEMIQGIIAESKLSALEEARNGLEKIIETVNPDSPVKLALEMFREG